MNINEIRKYVNNWKKNFTPIFDEEYYKDINDTLNSYDYKHTTLHIFLEEFVKTNWNNIKDFYITKPLSSSFFFLTIYIDNKNHFTIVCDRDYYEDKLKYGNIVVYYYPIKNNKIDEENRFILQTRNINEVIKILYAYLIKDEKS